MNKNFMFYVLVISCWRLRGTTKVNMEWEMCVINDLRFILLQSLADYSLEGMTNKQPK